ncbi:MAG TPA: acyl-CoA reductase [Candidatus Cybelea sp.]|jgi:acyl-CoA reductase-like NAD-dependent aldehyde dehydrogenase
MMVKTLPPVRSIIEAIAAAASAWSDPAFESRQRIRAAVSERTQYSLPVVDYAFDRLFRSITAAAMRDVIAAELGSVEVLDRFVTRAEGISARALPVGRVCVVASRTTIGVAIVPAIFALCAKCEVLVKDREDHLVAAFFATLAERLPELAQFAHARPWRGDDDRVDLAQFACVVAFGSDATLNAISQALCVPTRFIAYPSKASAGYVAREALSNESDAAAVARGAARDMLLYDGEGCLSLRTIFVERGGRIAPERFCELLAAAIESADERFPATTRIEPSAQRAMARELANFRTAVADRVVADPQTSYLVLLDAPAQEPPLFIPRALGVRSVDGPDEAATYLTNHRISVEALAVAPSSKSLLALAARTGAARIAPFGSLQAPALANLHGGRPRIAEFVRWLVDET